MEWLLLGLAFLLILGTGMFVAAEFSLLALDKHTVAESQARGERGSGIVANGMRHLSTQLSTAQVGITVTTLLTGYLMEPSLGSLLQGPLAALGVPEAAIGTISLTLAMLAATAMSMVFGELVPKNLAISVPLPTGRFAVPFQTAVMIALRPVIAVLNGTANRALRAMGIEPQEEGSSGRSPEELTALVRHSARSGTLDVHTADLLARTLAFSTRTAEDVMTPRTRMSTVPRDATAREILDLARQTGYSRFPVTGDGRDDLIGVVHMKQALAVPLENRDDAYAAGLMSPAIRVPETLPLDPLLMELRGQGLQMAVVVDEFGGTAGMVTLEDVVEELVGEVADEHDRMRITVRPARDGSWLVPGLMRPDEVNGVIPAQIAEDPGYETVGGFMMTALGRIPEVGDTVEITGGILRVERMQRRRVDRVRFIPASQLTEEAS